MKKIILSVVVLFAFMGCHDCEKVEPKDDWEYNSSPTFPNDNLPPMVKKPAIYLYPTKDEKVEVKLSVNGEIFNTIPPIMDNGWVVDVTKESKIDGKYGYLFYENTLNTPPKVSSSGWVVKKENISKWCDETLPKMGLNSVEIKDFKEYWVDKLQTSPYYQIKLLDRDFLDKNMKLSIKPKPQTLIRVIFEFKALDKEIKLPTPDIKTPNRDGFTVVEWGGI
jgi:hypothetical protein